MEIIKIRKLECHENTRVILNYSHWDSRDDRTDAHDRREIFGSRALRDRGNDPSSCRRGEQLSRSNRRRRVRRGRSGLFQRVNTQVLRFLYPLYAERIRATWLRLNSTKQQFNLNFMMLRHAWGSARLSSQICVSRDFSQLLWKPSLYHRKWNNYEIYEERTKKKYLTTNLYFCEIFSLQVKVYFILISWPLQLLL